MNNIEKYKTKMNEIWIDEEGIMWVAPTESCEIDLDEAKACFEIYKKLGCDKNKVLQMMDLTNSVTITKEARDYASVHGKDYFIAAAMVSDSLAVRIMVNFFNKFYKHAVPFRLFKEVESAKVWLRTFKK